MMKENKKVIKKNDEEENKIFQLTKFYDSDNHFHVQFPENHPKSQPAFLYNQEKQNVKK